MFRLDGLRLHSTAYGRSHESIGWVEGSNEAAHMPSLAPWTPLKVDQIEIEIEITLVSVALRGAVCQPPHGPEPQLSRRVVQSTSNTLHITFQTSAVPHNRVAAVDTGNMYRPKVAQSVCRQDPQGLQNLLSRMKNRTRIAKQLVMTQASKDYYRSKRWVGRTRKR